MTSHPRHMWDRAWSAVHHQGAPLRVERTNDSDAEDVPVARRIRGFGAPDPAPQPAATPPPPPAWTPDEGDYA